MTRFALPGPTVLVVVASCGSPPMHDSVDHRGPVSGLTWSDGRLFSCSQAGVFEGLPPTMRRLPPTGFRTFQVAAFRRDDGVWLAVCGGTPAVRADVAVLDPTGRHRARASFGEDVAHSVATVGGDRLVVGCADGRVWSFALPDLDARQQLWQHTAPCRAVGVMADGTYVSGGLDGNLLIGSIGAAPIVLQDHTAGIVTVAAGARCASGSLDGKLRLHGPDGRLVRTYSRLGSPALAIADGPLGLLCGLADGRLLALSEADATHRTVATFDAPLHSLALTDDGLVVGTGERVALVPASTLR
jgi:hypothetical protein